MRVFKTEAHKHFHTFFSILEDSSKSCHFIVLQRYQCYLIEIDIVKFAIVECLDRGGGGAAGRGGGQQISSQ